MFIRDACIASLLAVLGYASAAYAQVNSCSNVGVIGFAWEELKEGGGGMAAQGTWRIEGETDENKQPAFNYTMVGCKTQRDDTGTARIQCTVTIAGLIALGEPPAITPAGNCTLNLDIDRYSMNENHPELTGKGVLTGVENTSLCFNTTLTLDRDSKRVYQSFTKASDAPDNCPSPSRTQVLMNCTWSAKRAKNILTPGRYCDFGNK